MKNKSIVALSFLLLTNVYPLLGTCSIVFVHLGQKLPNYVRDALHQARLFNAEPTIYLVANEEVALDAEDIEILKADTILVVHCETLKRSVAHDAFLKNSSLDTVSKDGFWIKTCERFFYLEELITQYNLEDTFHLENDNMLYCDLNELLLVFKSSYSALGAVFDNDNRCIPSFIYVAHADAITKLAHFFTAKAHQGLFDMQLIALYKKTYGNMAIGSLPIVMKRYIDTYGLGNALGDSVKNEQEYCQNIESFDSIFDAAAIGQFLGGIDPCHKPRDVGPGFINESCVFNPSLLTYEWIIDGKGRKIPYAICKGEKYRINNLHIHSKNLEAFRS